MKHYSTLYVGMDVHRDSFTLAQSGQFFFGTFCCHFAVYNVFNNVFESFESSRLGFLITPFLKCVSSNFSKRTNNPNPSPIRKIWFGLSLSGAGDRTRTSTALGPGDFKSPVSAIPPHRRMR